MEKDYLNDKEILFLIDEYIYNSNLNQAIMINGKWGTGKTYFIKEKVMRKEYYGKTFLYLSLHGLQAKSEIDDKLYNVILESYLKGKIGKFYMFAKKGINSLYDILKAFKSVPEIPSGSIRSIIEMLQKNEEKDFILILDDLERCSIPINDLLGYVNEFVENRKMKVILVANEEEIVKRSSVENDNTSIYDEIKEKVIWRKIEFKPKLEKKIDNIINYSVKNKNVKEYLICNIECIYKYFDEIKCSNLRTVKCLLYYIEKILIEVNKMNYDEDEINFLPELKEKICKYIMNSLNKENVEEKIINEAEYKFGSIDKYITNGYLDKKILKSDIKKFIENEKKIKSDSDDPVTILKKYWELEDNDILSNISFLIQKLENNEYPISSYNLILAISVGIERMKFEDFKCKKIIEIMKDNIDKLQFYNETFDWPEFTLEDEEVNNEYLKMKVELKNKKTDKLRDTGNKLIDNNTEWGSDILKFVESNSEILLREGRFLSLFDVKKLENCILNSNVKNLIDFKEAINIIYKMENIYDFYLMDEGNLKILFEFLKQCDKEVEKKSRNYNIKLLRRDVDAILKKYIRNITKLEKK